jgi:hypothetical protein
VWEGFEEWLPGDRKEAKQVKEENRDSKGRKEVLRPTLMEQKPHV